MKKLFLLLTKYIPIIQMVGMCLNNTLYYFDVCRPLCYCIDFILGNSILATILIFVISYVFKFCDWYRIIIITNLINLIYAGIDSIHNFPITNLELLIVHYIICSIGIICATYCHIKQKQNEIKGKTT